MIFYRPGQNLNNAVPGKYRYQWVEQSFTTDGTKTASFASPVTNKFLGTSISTFRRRWLFLVLSAITLLLISRVGWLQIARGAHYFALAQDNRLRLRPVSAERGIIYDRFGQELVQNVPSFSLAIVPQNLPRNAGERQAELATVSALAGISIAELEEQILRLRTTGYDAVTVRENLDYQSALRLYLRSADLPGVIIDTDTRRQYLATSTLSLAHVLGYLGKLDAEEANQSAFRGYAVTERIGKIGVEKIQQEILRGIPGRKKIEVNAYGQEQNILAVSPPQPGKNIYLTIDAEAQKVLEDLVRSASNRLSASRFAAIALNPQNGEILALVSWPTFDNNAFSGGLSNRTYAEYLNNPDQPLFNRAIAGMYPPGSVVKPIVAAAGLDANIITSETTILSVGGFQVGNIFFRDWLPGGHGATSLLKALAWSVNTYFYYVGGGRGQFTGLGLERLRDYLARFQLGQKTGIDLPSEASGFVPSAEWKKQTKQESWFIGDTYNISIGEGDLLVTPLQVAVSTAAIANGGNIVAPHLLRSIGGAASAKQSILIPSAIRQNIVKPSAIRGVMTGMSECVHSGSCHLLATLPFSSAGKTGTAQWSKNRNTHAWFTAFAPLANPQIVITVLIEEGGEGGLVSAPIARDFLRWWGKKYLP